MVSGLVHGLWSQRWQPSEGLADAVTRTERVPLTVGDWDGSEEEMDPDLLRQARLESCWMRRYTNRQTGAAVTALLMCGRPGPVSVHTPNSCYRGAGFEPLAAQTRFTVAGADFWTAKFRKADAALPVTLRILWAWNDGGGWLAPDHPRLEFARRGALYKLYVLREMSSPAERLEEDPCAEFLRCLLPVLDKALSPDAAPARAETVPLPEGARHASRE